MYDAGTNAKSSLLPKLIPQKDKDCHYGKASHFMAIKGTINQIYDINPLYLKT